MAFQGSEQRRVLVKRQPSSDAMIAWACMRERGAYTTNCLRTAQKKFFLITGNLGIISYSSGVLKQMVVCTQSKLEMP